MFIIKKDMSLYFGIISIYVSSFFLFLSRFLYDIEQPSFVRGQFDFDIWMKCTPLTLKLSIITPLIIGFYLIIKKGIKYFKN